MRKLLLLHLFLTTLISIPHAVQAQTAEKILFVEKGEGNRHYLVSVQPDGSGKKSVSKGYFYIVAPHSSQANGLILFTLHDEAMKSSVQTLRPEAAGEKILDGACAHAWSPDGKSVLYSPSGQECDLYRYQLASKSKQRLTRGKMVIDACWSADGKKIALSVMESDGNMDLYLYTVQGARLDKLTRTPGASEHSPNFSPDGLTLLYCHQPFKGLAGCDPGWLAKLDLTSKKVTPLPVRDVSSPSLSADGQWVVFEDSGTDEIGICKADGSARRKLSLQGSSPTWIK